MAFLDQKELYNSFLLKQFHEFYSEIIRQKKYVKLYTESPLTGEVPGETQSESPVPGEVSETGESESPLMEKASEETLPKGVATDPINLKLLEVLERQVLDARRQGGEYGVVFYKEAQYVMAALADEIFLHTDWEGKEAWKSNLLEFKLFGTYIAGELFFQKIDKLLKDRDPAYIEMAAVYFLALALGFKGKFRDKDDGGLLENYRRQLFALIFKSNPDLISETRILFPESTVHTLTQGGGEKLPYIRWWIGLIVLLIIIFLIVSHSIWIHLTEDLVNIVEKIVLEFAGMK